MATIPLNIGNATPPYNISVKKQGEGYERFRGYNSGILVFEPATDGVSALYNVVVSDGNNCTALKSFSLVCGGGGGEIPSFAVELIQPRCSVSGTFQNALLKITNAQNVTRYKICYNSTTFNSSCNIDCAGSNGTISGSSADITIQSPAQGSRQDVTIRFYNGAGCDKYYDYSFKLNSPSCDDITLGVLDLVINQPSLGAECERPNTYSREYNVYVTPNTIGLEAINGQKAQAGTGGDRNLPNGNDVPNVYISAPFKASCGQPGTSGSSITSIFYRFAFNFSLLRANFPNVNDYRFDVYASVSKGTGANFTVTRVSFKGIAMAKLLHSNNSVDAYRDPYDTTPDSVPNGNAPYSGTGYKKVGTFSYNYTTNTITWIPG